MSWMDNLTKVIDNRVHIDDSEGKDLLEYTNQECKALGCPGDWELPNNADIDCDCPIALMYWATVKLCEWEHQGMSFREYRDMMQAKEREQQ